MAKHTTKGDPKDLVESLKILYQLWNQENAIVNQKLAMYLAAQSLLIVALNRIPDSSPYVSLVGIVISIIWFLSIGRTVEYRKLWQRKIKERLEGASETTQRHFAIFPVKTELRAMAWYGRTRSIFVLLWSPLLGVILWIAFFINMLFLHR